MIFELWDLETAKIKCKNMMMFEIWMVLAIFNVVPSQGASCDISGLCNVILIKSLIVKQF